MSTHEPDAIDAVDPEEHSAPPKVAVAEAAPPTVQPPATGDDAVDTALSGIPTALGRPLEEQLTVFEAAHTTLQDRLSDVEG